MNTADPLLELLPEAAWQVDASCRPVASNALAAAMVGSGLTEALVRLPGFPAWVAGEGGELFSGRLTAERANGVPVTVQVSARRNPAGGALCLLAELDRNQVPFEAQRYFDIAFDTAPIGMALFNTDGEYIRVNQALCHLLGRSPDELLGRRDQEFTHPEDRQSDLDAAWRILRGDISTWQTEKRFLRPDGSVVWTIANLTFLRDPQGNPMSWVGQFQDISRRKALEVSLTEREQRTRQILETALDAFVSVDAQGVIVDWNPQAQVTFGWQRDEVAGRRFVDVIVPAPQRELYRQNFEWLVARDGRELGQLFEITAVDRAGREFPVELSLWRQQTSAGPTVSAFLRDISARKATQQALTVAHQAALEASRMKSEFVANMSHEIRTPLNGVIGMSGLLLGTDLNEEQRDYAEAIRTSGDALMAIVGDILDFSKIEAGKLELDATPVVVRDLVEDVITLVSAAAQGKQIELLSWVDEAVPAAVLGDENRIRQILTNLVGNAVKFTSAGEVVVSVLRQPADRGDDLVGLRFEVTDTGVGIEDSALSRVFESFSQADGSSARRFGGTGLGLAISKRLVGLMGGDIAATSTFGVGSTFWFEVSLPAAAGAGGRPSVVARLPPVRALISVPNPTVAGILRRQLSAWGLVCELADGDNSTLAMLGEAVASGRPFGLLVAEAASGRQGGMLATAIGASPALGATPVLLLASSAYDQHELSGTSAVVPRPIRSSRLHRAVAGLLAPPPAGRPLGPAGSAGPAQPGMRPGQRVLVAEDNSINQLVAVHMLENRGFSVDRVGNGIEAVAWATQRHYAAIFMDCQMPEMDGYGATEELRRREGDQSHTPIIAMTANTTPEDRRRCLAAGMDDYISKPIRPEVLDAVIAKVLPSADRGQAS